MLGGESSFSYSYFPMKKLFLQLSGLFLLTFFTASLGSLAWAMDKETRENFNAISKRFDQISAAEKQRHQEQVRLLSQTLKSVKSGDDAISNQNAAEIKKSLEAILLQLNVLLQRPQPQPATASPTLPANNGYPPVVQAPGKGIAPSTETGSIPKEFLDQQKALQKELADKSDFIQVFQVLTTILVIAILVILVIFVKKAPAAAKKEEKTETFPIDISPKRPILKVNMANDKVYLVNTGDLNADDIRLYVGSGPRTMKQKINSTNKIALGQRSELVLPEPFDHGTLHMTIEYKNAQNGRVYKDSFILKREEETSVVIPAP